MDQPTPPDAAHELRDLFAQPVTQPMRRKSSTSFHRMLARGPRRDLPCVLRDQSCGTIRISLRVGQITLDSEFAVLDSYGGLFLHIGFGALEAFSANLPLPVYPNDTRGARVRVKLINGLSLQVAAFDGNVAPGLTPDPSPDAAPSNEFNRRGTHWALRRDEGALLIGEIWVQISTEPMARPLRRAPAPMGPSTGGKRPLCSEAAPAATGSASFMLLGMREAMLASLAGSISSLRDATVANEEFGAGKLRPTRGTTPMTKVWNTSFAALARSPSGRAVSDETQNAPARSDEPHTPRGVRR